MVVYELNLMFLFFNPFPKWVWLSCSDLRCCADGGFPLCEHIYIDNNLKEFRLWFVGFVLILIVCEKISFEARIINRS